MIIQASAGTTEISGGWDIVGQGQHVSSGTSQTGCLGNDPSITLGVASVSSQFGSGQKSTGVITGSQNINIDIAGFRLETIYDGTVDSSVALTSPGSAYASAFVGVSATGLSTGRISATDGDSYDLFGQADITTEGFVYGKGSASASASGSASYDVKKLGTPAEVWGQVDGSSSMNLDSGSSTGAINTGGNENGLHAESRVTKTMQKEISASALSKLTSYASVINTGKANVNNSGKVHSGSWDSTFAGSDSDKIKSIDEAGNEDVAASVTGTLGTLDHVLETKADNDAADVSSILQSSASKDLKASGELVLEVSGGPATYAAASQSSSSTETYAQTWVRNAIWGSLAKTANNQQILEWGKVENVGSGAITNEPSSALSFAKILMTTNYTVKDGKATAAGSFTIPTYAQATKNVSALGGSIIDGTGKGEISAKDGSMSNSAGYEGGMNHISFVDAGKQMSTGKGFAQTANIASIIFAGADPGGNYGVSKPFQTDTSADPIFAWSSSEGFFRQSH